MVIGDSSTHGKGTVQAVLEMKNYLRQFNTDVSRTGAAKLTIQKFYLPNGASTQKKGVVPDITLPSIEDFLPIGESDLPHALMWDEIRPTNFEGRPLERSFLEPLLKASLDRQQHLVLARQAAHQVLVQRLGEAGIRDGRAEAAGSQLVGGLQRLLQAGAEGQDGDRAALPQHAALPARTPFISPSSKVSKASSIPVRKGPRLQLTTSAPFPATVPSSFAFEWRLTRRGPPSRASVMHSMRSSTLVWPRPMHSPIHSSLPV